MNAFPQVQGRCPACRRTTLILGVGAHITCAHLDCPNPTAASDLLEQQPQPGRLGERCEITLDVVTAGRKLQTHRTTPLMPADPAASRAIVALELRSMAAEVEALQDLEEADGV